MTKHKAKPTPFPRRLGKVAAIGAVALLASLTACSQAQTSTPGEKVVAAKNDTLVSEHPFGDKTPAQRRAAWLKRGWTREPTQAVAQNGGTKQQPLGQ